MYVGEEEKRYELPLKYLSSPAFLTLMIKEGEDVHHVKIEGPIRLACKPAVFNQFLKLAQESTESAKCVCCYCFRPFFL